MKKVDMRAYKEKLLDLRARLRGDVSTMAKVALRKSGMVGSESSGMPIHMAELGSDNFEQEFTLSLLATEEDTLGLLSELIDLNPSGLIDDESLLLADLGDLIPSAQPSVEYSVETTGLVADLSMADHYDDHMMNYDILVGVSELG